MQIEQHVAKEKNRAPPKVKPRKPVDMPGAKVEREKQKPLFDIPVSGEVPALDLLDAPPDAGGRGYLLMSWNPCRAYGAQAQGFWRRGESCGNSFTPGHVVTRFEIQPRRALKFQEYPIWPRTWRAHCCDFGAGGGVIPGKASWASDSNADRQTVNFRDVLASKPYLMTRNQCSHSPWVMISQAHRSLRIWENAAPAGAERRAQVEVGRRQLYAGEPAL